MTKKVRIHCGSAFVRGAARRWRYFVASLFEARETKAGHMVWRNSGETTQPRRSRRLCEEDARALAHEHGAEYVPGYGSLHNERIPPEKMWEGKLVI